MLRRHVIYARVPPSLAVPWLDHRAEQDAVAAPTVPTYSLVNWALLLLHSLHNEVRLIFILFTSTLFILFYTFMYFYSYILDTVVICSMTIFHLRTALSLFFRNWTRTSWRAAPSSYLFLVVSQRSYMSYISNGSIKKFGQEKQTGGWDCAKSGLGQPGRQANTPRKKCGT